MAKLYFKVGSDWEEVVRLRNEIVKLKQELMSMDGTQSPAAFKALNVQLAASNQRLDELVTYAAKYTMAKKLSIPYPKRSLNKKTSYVRHRMMFQCLQNNIRN